ncbi:MAG TPA: polysaccharide biosynthesis tyrosine autokinase [Gemmataceae bacterium]|nr:polysaccharide biosynthesis tyrosine autokinase [Gemmataceae bacterium]
MSTQEPSKSHNGHNGAESNRLPPYARGKVRVAGTPAALSPPLNAWALLEALRRRWLAALVLGVLAAAAVGAAIWYFLPPAPYTASAKFRIESKPEGTIYDHPEGKTDFGNYEQMQVALIKGQMVLNNALKSEFEQRPGVKVPVAQLPEVRKAVDPVDWLEKQVHIDFPNGQEILHLTISSDDKDVCKILVDALSAAYLDEVGDASRRHREDKRKELQELVDKLDRELDGLRADIRKKAEPVGSQDTQVLALKQKLALEEAKRAQHDLEECDSRLNRLKNEQSLLPKADDLASVVIPASDVDALVDKIPDIAKLLGQKAGLQSVINDTIRQAKGGKDNPVVQQLQAQLKDVQTTIDEKRNDARKDCETELRNAAVGAAGKRAAIIKDDIAFEEKLKDRLIDEITQQVTQSNNINKVTLDLEDQKAKVTRAEMDQAKAAGELQKLSIEKDDPYRVSLWEETVVTHPDEAVRKMQMAGLGGAGTFLLVLLLVALVEFRSRRVHTPQQIVRGLGITLVGTVPARPTGPVGGNPVWQNLLTESIDATRTMILHGARPKPVRAVLITSAVGGEGKTSLSSHLAVSLARSGRKTLLIDGDLRNPAMHRLFEVPVAPGFSELLRGDAPASQVIRPTPVPNLHLMPAGKSDPATLALLSQGGVADLLTGLKGSFDAIIIDSSPILPVADGLQLARHVDGVLLSVLQDVSTLPGVHEARQRLAALGVPILGAVVSGTRPNVAYYGRRYLHQTPAAHSNGK